jgi:uncharacterized membrane protein YczE
MRGKKRLIMASFGKRVMVYSVGLFLIALGVAISIKSDLGVSPVNSLPYVISLITEVEMGRVSATVFVCYIVIQIFLLKKQFKWIGLTQILFSVIFGYFLSFANRLVYSLSPETYMARLGLLVISMFVISVGIILYVRAQLVLMPPEGLVQTIQVLTKIDFYRVKIAFDSLSVSLAVVLSLIFMGGIFGVREGTVFAAFGIGKIIGILEGRFKNQIDQLTRLMQ